MARKAKWGFQGCFAARWNSSYEPLVLIRTYEYVSKAGVRFTVPAGFLTDLASIPRPCRSFAPSVVHSARAAVLHDYLYATHLVSRREADELFFEALEAVGVSVWDCWKMWMAVRVFGRCAYGKEARIAVHQARAAESADSGCPDLAG